MEEEMLPMVEVPVPEILMDHFCILFHEVGEEFKAVGVYLLEFYSEYLLVGLYYFLIDELDLVFAEAGDVGEVIGEVVDVFVVVSVVASGGAVMLLLMVPSSVLDDSTKVVPSVVVVVEVGDDGAVEAAKAGGKVEKDLLQQ